MSDAAIRHLAGRQSGGIAKGDGLALDLGQAVDRGHEGGACLPREDGRLGGVGAALVRQVGVERDG